MTKEEIEEAKFKVDLPWKWFDLHAKQRQSNIQFSLSLITGLFAVVGYLINSERYFVAATLCVFGLVGSLIFYGLDRRNSYLVKLGESGIKEFEIKYLSQEADKPFRVMERVGGDSNFYLKYSTAAKLIFALSSISFLVALIYSLNNLRTELHLLLSSFTGCRH